MRIVDFATATLAILQLDSRVALHTRGPHRVKIDKTRSEHKRPSALPDVPTMAEAGMPDFDTSLWFGLLAPAGTPRPVIEKLANAAHKALHTPEAVETLRKQGFDPLDGGPDEFGAFIRSEVARWSEVARSTGLKS